MSIILRLDPSLRSFCLRVPETEIENDMTESFRIHNNNNDNGIHNEFIFSYVIFGVTSYTDFKLFV